MSKKIYLALMLSLVSSNSLYAMNEELGENKSKININLQGQQVPEELDSRDKKWETTASRQVQSSLWLHVNVGHNMVKAWAKAWTTKGQDEDSERVKVGSIRLKLHWFLDKESTAHNTYHHSLEEWFTGSYLLKAKASAWLTNPYSVHFDVKTKW